MKNSQLPNYLRMFRKRSGLGQHELAFLMDTDRSTVSRYEAGLRVPGLPKLIIYEAVFHEPLSRLFAGVHDEVVSGLRQRAMGLHKELDGAEEHTAAIRQKMEFLVDVTYPTQTWEC